MSSFSQQQLNDFATLFATALATAQANQPPAQINVQGPPGMPASNKSVIATPRAYEGGNDFREFRTEVQLYVAGSPNAFPQGDIDKILFVLSYMKGGAARAWSLNYIEEFTTPAGTIFTDTFDAFLTKLGTAFDDPNEKEKAMTEITSCKQGRKTAVDFFTQFDILRTQAGLNAAAHDSFLIHLLQHALSPSVVRLVMSRQTVPTTYSAWRAEALKMDGLEQSLRYLGKDNQPAPAPKSWNVPAPVSAPPRPAPQPQAPAAQPYRDHQGVAAGTHPGMGIPMDVSINWARRNRACFKCGQIGHFAKSCPNGRQIIRAALLAMDSYDRMELADELNKIKESEGTADEQEDLEVRAVPAELQEIIDKQGFLAAQ